ncbi:MAG: serine protease [Anaerolineae bacterium CFX3]|nr:serine protease [Anaerolineae bacterium CFX3]MCQ3945920.1 serine protease [Anaerolineae bacterium]RIK26890.1 MAG: serine protease [Anaerolineae bacterium]
MMKRQANFTFLIVTILALIASVGVSTGSANAQEAALDPNTPVSNIDGVLPMAEISGLKSSAPHVGNGRLSKTNTIIPEADLNLAPLGGGSPESVIGADGRKRQNPTTAFPNRAIAYLVVKFPSGTGSCTGWFIGPRTVITAGHCVYDASTNKWATSITVYPGRNGASAPYGSTTSHRLFSVSGWTSSHNPSYDYGAIQTKAAKGNTVGWFGYRWQASNAFPGNFTVKGYPGDKPSGQQWFMSGPVTHVNTYRFWYNIDTYGGQSGSPFYQWWTGSGCTKNCYYGVGIHTYGTSVSPYFGNSATRIRQAVFNNFKTWRNHPYP